MQNNPFAAVFRQAFEQDVLSSSIKFTSKEERQSSLPTDTKAFLDELNSFLKINQVRPLDLAEYIIDEHKLVDYALFLRGYMRDAQPVLANLRNEFASDINLVNLFKAASEYIVSANHRMGGKKVFKNQVDYYLWKLSSHESLPSATYALADQRIDISRPNMFLFMPFRIKGQEQEVQKWVFMNMRSAMDNQKVFGEHVDVYVQHYPIQKSRSANIYSLLRTLREAPTYFEEADLNFVKKHWLDFVGKDLELDSKGRVVSGSAYTSEQLAQNFGNISIFAYCSGAANAHRCLNALQDIAKQIYDEETVQQAMKKVGVMTYGFLPLLENSPYSGIHFYTNAVDDVNRHEPFVNLNNHELYEQTKCLSKDEPARFSVMPDGRNFVVALRMPEEMAVWQGHQSVPFKDSEFGHSIRFVTEKNIADKNNYPYNLFRSTFERFSLGVRGTKALDLSGQSNPDNILINNYLLGARRQL